MTTLLLGSKNGVLDTHRAVADRRGMPTGRAACGVELRRTWLGQLDPARDLICGKCFPQPAYGRRNLVR